MDLETLRRANMTPIIRMHRVESSDVDGVIYFADNVGNQIKRIDYYDTNGLLQKRDCFTYQDIGGKTDNVRCIFSSFDSDFIGAWASTSEPDKTGLKANAFYYIAEDVTINGTSYKENEILGLVDVGYKVLKWKKCRIDSNGNLSEV